MSDLNLMSVKERLIRYDLVCRELDAYQIAIHQISMLMSDETGSRPNITGDIYSHIDKILEALDERLVDQITMSQQLSAGPLA